MASTLLCRNATISFRPHGGTEVLPLGGNTASPYSMMHYTTMHCIRDTFDATLQPPNISCVLLSQHSCVWRPIYYSLLCTLCPMAHILIFPHFLCGNPPSSSFSSFDAVRPFPHYSTAMHEIPPNKLPAGDRSTSRSVELIRIISTG